MLCSWPAVIPYGGWAKMFRGEEKQSRDLLNNHISTKKFKYFMSMAMAVAVAGHFVDFRTMNE